MATPTYYQIRVKGYLPDHWSDWFGEMTLTLDDERGETILSGPVVDQATLHGLLNKVRDLGLKVLTPAAVIIAWPEFQQNQLMGRV